MTLVEVISQQMSQLRLNGMRETYEIRAKQAREQALPCEDFMGLLIQDEIEYRNGAKIKRLLRTASLRCTSTLEEIDTRIDRGLDKKQLRELATCRYIDDGLNILILGPTGVGKTHTASAIGNAACRQGYTTLFYRMNTLIEQLMLARAKGTYLNLIKKMAGCDLLILDDFGIKPLDPQHYQDLYDVIDERGDEKSTIITSQLPVENWSEIIGDPVTCEAITDRLSSMAIRMVMKGSSYRSKRQLKKEPKLDKE